MHGISLSEFPMKCDPFDTRWLWIAAVVAATQLFLATNSPSSPSLPIASTVQRRAIVADFVQPLPRATPEPARVPLLTPEPAPPRPNLDQILGAIRRVETGGTPAQGARAIGDDGRAIGPFQIHRSYWKDARIPGSFEDCFDASYARRVVLSYWRRHCPEAMQSLDAEVLARVHNGGPTGFRKSSTAGYWRKVERLLTSSTKR